MRGFAAILVICSGAAIAAPASAQQTAAERIHLACLTTQDIDDRIDACSMAIVAPGLSPALLSDAYAIRGGMHFVRGDFEQAKADYRKAEEIDPTRYMESGNKITTLADAAERSAASLTPKAAMEACRNWRDPERRLRACDRFVQAMSTSDEERGAAVGLRGVVESQLGKADESLRDINESVRLLPGNKAFQQARAEAMWRLGRYTEAKAEMDRLVASGTDPDRWAQQFAVYAYIQGQPSQAADMLDAISKRHPEATMNQFYAAMFRAEIDPDHQKDAFKIYVPLSEGPFATISVQYRLGQASEAQLLNVIDALLPHQRETAMCQGHFNIGQRAALEHASGKAVLELQLALKTCQRATFEYDVGKIWLKRLGAG
jgi:tetratricopeptide (TPR) repeat protein